MTAITASFMQRLLGRQQKRAASAEDAFWELVQSIGDGKTIEDEHAEAVLTAAGRTAQDLHDEVSALVQRRQWLPQLEKMPSLEQEFREIEEARARRLAEINAQRLLDSAEDEKRRTRLADISGEMARLQNLGVSFRTSLNKTRKAHRGATENDAAARVVRLANELVKARSDAEESAAYVKGIKNGGARMVGGAALMNPKPDRPNAYWEKRAPEDARRVAAIESQLSSLREEMAALERAELKVSV
jgi:hypothetical protein